ncbi:hypothetical protein [Lysinibacillus xylanilyticus]|uniref:hypothetical protein n=1 Tax=Lysinibacillus xylanilyticus TaxID=582475 RepID=UPI003D001A5A
MEWRLGDSLGISVTGTKAKTIMSCDNAFVTNIVPLPHRFRAKNIVPLPHRFRAKNICWPKRLIDAPKKLCSVRKRSDSNNKAPSRKGNRQHVMEELCS